MLSVLQTSTMKSEPVFSVVRRSTSGGRSRSFACAAAVGVGALAFAGWEACALAALETAIVAPPAATTPLRNRRRCRPDVSDLAMGILPFFDRPSARMVRRSYSFERD